jgi:hypothetical protein
VTALLLAFALGLLAAAAGGGESVWVPSLAVVVVGALNFCGLLLVHRRVGSVVDEVKTANGNTLAELADKAEGRRVLADVAPGDRTTSEQHAAEIIEPNPNDRKA